MFKFFKRKNPGRESFDSFMMNEILQNPALSLEDALDLYIEKYSLAIRHSLDEPKMVTEKRTKLKILEDSLFSEPKNCNDPQVHQYLANLRMFVESFNSLSPEILKGIKKREENN
jgi:hypothetical protein